MFGGMPAMDEGVVVLDRERVACMVLSTMHPDMEEDESSVIVLGTMVGAKGAFFHGVK